jgi:hypothetical protein
MTWDKDRDWVLNLWFGFTELMCPYKTTPYIDSEDRLWHKLRNLPRWLWWLNRKIWAWRTGYAERCNLPLSDQWWKQHLSKFRYLQHEDNLLVREQLCKNVGSNVLAN